MMNTETDVGININSVGCDKDIRMSRTLIRRTTIKAVAARLFATSGFHLTGVAQIAAESGMAVGAIYRYFPAKADIIAEVAADNCRRFMAVEDLNLHIQEGNYNAVEAWLLRLIEPTGDVVEHTLFAETVAESFRNVRVATHLKAMRANAHHSILSALEFLSSPSASESQRTTTADTILAISMGVMYFGFPRLAIDKQVIINLRSIIADQLNSLVGNAEEAQ